MRHSLLRVFLHFWILLGTGTLVQPSYAQHAANSVELARSGSDYSYSRALQLVGRVSYVDLPPAVKDRFGPGLAKNGTLYLFDLLRDPLVRKNYEKAYSSLKESDFLDSANYSVAGLPLEAAHSPKITVQPDAGPLGAWIRWPSQYPGNAYDDYISERVQLLRMDQGEFLVSKALQLCGNAQPYCSPTFVAVDILSSEVALMTEGQHSQNSGRGEAMRAVLLFLRATENAIYKVQQKEGSSKDLPFTNKALQIETNNILSMERAKGLFPTKQSAIESAARQQAALSQPAIAESSIRNVKINPPDVVSIVGSYPNDLLTPDSINQSAGKLFTGKIKEVIGASNFEIFVAGLGLANKIDRRGNFVLGSGCLPHFCDNRMSAFAIDLRTGRLMAFHYDVKGSPPLLIWGTKDGRVPVELCEDLGTDPDAIPFFCQQAAPATTLRTGLAVSEHIKHASFPRNYQGDSISELMGKFKKIESASNDEFVKRSEINGAAAALRSREYRFVVAPETNLAFEDKFPLKAKSGVKYDADAEILHINLWVANQLFWSERADTRTILQRPTYTTLVVSSTSKHRNYIGQNAYGAKADVSSSLTEEDGVAFANIKQDQGTAILTASLALSPSYARVMKSDLAFYIVVQPTASKDLKGNVLDTIGGKEATITQPSEYYTSGRYLVVNLKEAGVFRSSTGEVIKWVKFD